MTIAHELADFHSSAVDWLAMSTGGMTPDSEKFLEPVIVGVWPDRERRSSASMGCHSNTV